MGAAQGKGGRTTTWRLSTRSTDPATSAATTTIKIRQATTKAPMIKKTVAVVAIISACLLVWTMATQWRDCAADGKAFVRGALWFECVAR